MRILIIAILILLVANANSQSMYKMEILPIYDEEGNLYQLRQVFDHIPTNADTIEFSKDVKNYMSELNKAKKLIEKAQKSKQYKAVVSEIKKDKEGNTVIKPNNKFKSDWYKCYDVNVKIGDTIFISKEEAIIPIF